MYASVRRYTMGAGALDSLTHRVDAEFAPALAQQPGFIAYFLMDTGDETLESISIFHEESSANVSDQLAAEYVNENLAEFELTRTDATTGEVLVSRATAEALEEMHRWRSGRARLRSS
jgi:hypothetical protein